MASRVLGVLGGKDIPDDALVAWLSSADVIYAADSGADRVIALGFRPIVVGDFDSFASLPNSDGLRLVQSIDQETTDCDKLLALVHNDGHRSITLTGTEGDLPDHVLATYSSAIASDVDVRFAFRRGIGWLVTSQRVVESKKSQRVSLMPLTPCNGVSLHGVTWPVEGAYFGLGGAVSISNVATGSEVAASLESGCALLFLESGEVVW